LHALLALRDPETAKRLMPTDPQRIVRALEVLESTGRPLSDWQHTPGEPVLAEADTVRLVVLPEREAMMQTIERRFDAMLDEGAPDEVRALMALGLSRELPVMRALGVAPLVACLEGRMTPEAAAAQAKADTRQYAKRQLTWLRRNMIAWQHVDAQQMQRIDISNISFIDS
jgi:tRNA dimethylallyltransferase